MKTRDHNFEYCDECGQSTPDGFEIGPNHSENCSLWFPIPKNVSSSTINTKIIFLDHDGVLAPTGFCDLDQEFSISCVKILNEILLETNAEIVVSSDWRTHFTLKNLCDIYQNCGIIKSPIGVTDNFWTKNSSILDLEKIRAVEISTWVNTNKPSKWVAIDDMKLPLKNFVLVDDKEGLVQKGIKEEILLYLL